MKQSTRSKKQQRYVKLWLKFKPEYQHTPNGVVIHKNRCAPSEAGIRKAMRQFHPYLSALIRAEKICQARMYDSLDNTLLFQWPDPSSQPQK